MSSLSPLTLLSVSTYRSMNAYLIVYLCILISKALINTVLKYMWQADPDRDEPWYNGKTESEKQRHIVGRNYNSHNASACISHFYLITDFLFSLCVCLYSLPFSRQPLSLSFPPSLPLPLSFSLPGDQGVHRLPGLHGVV